MLQVATLQAHRLTDENKQAIKLRNTHEYMTKSRSSTRRYQADKSRQREVQQEYTPTAPQSRIQNFQSLLQTDSLHRIAQCRLKRNISFLTTSRHASFSGTFSASELFWAVLVGFIEISELYNDQVFKSSLTLEFLAILVRMGPLQALQKV